MNWEQYALHDHTRHELERFMRAPGHGLLLLGANGAGKTTLALSTLAVILELTPEKLLTHPYFLHLKPEKNSISIEAIRGTQEFVRLKTTGTKGLRRAILIEDAHTLTTEAQNAFLKLLEEPPKDTIIIMTATQKDALLPTILSRTQRIVVKAPTQEQLMTYFTKHGHAPTDITKSYHISKGQPGLMSQLLANDENQVLLHYIDTAKKLLRQTPFERLAYVDVLSKKKDELPGILWGLQRVCDVALYQASQRGANKQTVYWQELLKTTVHAQDNLSANPQPKLLLTHLALAM